MTTPNSTRIVKLKIISYLQLISANYVLCTINQSLITEFKHDVKYVYIADNINLTYSIYQKYIIIL